MKSSKYIEQLSSNPVVQIAHLERESVDKISRCYSDLNTIRPSRRVTLSTWTWQVNCHLLDGVHNPQVIKRRCERLDRRWQLTLRMKHEVWRTSNFWSTKIGSAEISHQHCRGSLLPNFPKFRYRTKFSLSSDKRPKIDLSSPIFLAKIGDPIQRNRNLLDPRSHPRSFNPETPTEFNLDSIKWEAPRSAPHTQLNIAKTEWFRRLPRHRKAGYMANLKHRNSRTSTRGQW